MNATFTLAARLARREVRRRPGRTALVALLVALPVAALVVSAVLLRTDRVAPAQEWKWTFGSADVVAYGGSETVGDGSRPGADPASPSPWADELPPGTRTATVSHAYVPLGTEQGARGHAYVTNLPLNHPVTRGVFKISEGRSPEAADEVLLTPQLASKFGVGVGDDLVLTRPGPSTLQVVGIGSQRGWHEPATVVVAPGQPVAVTPDGTDTLIDLPEGMIPSEVDAVLVALGRGHSPSPDLQAVYGGGHGTDERVALNWNLVIGAVLFMVVGIVIASAFASGARRQLTTLGQLAANGATPGVLRRVLFLQGTWIGGIGAAAGVALGSVALATLAPHRTSLGGRDVGGWDVDVLDFLPIMALGVVAATLAAMVPARTTSRIPTLSALAGRRPLTAVPGWLTASGLAAVAGGLGLLAVAIVGVNAEQGDGSNGVQIWSLVGIAGGAGLLLGTCAAAPRYVSVLGPLAGRLSGPWRLAARSLARQRTRTGGVVSAVCATGALAVAAATLVVGIDAEDRARGEYMPSNQVNLGTRAAFADGSRLPAALAPPEDLVARVGQVLTDAEAARISIALPPEGLAFGEPLSDFIPTEGTGWVAYGLVGLDRGAAIADPATMSIYRLDAAARRRLAEAGAAWIGRVDGSAVVPLYAEGRPPAIPEGAPAVRPDPSPDGTPGRSLPVAVIRRTGDGLGGLPPLLVTAETAAAAGLVRAPGPVVFRQADPLNRDQRAQLRSIAHDLAGTGGEISGSCVGLVCQAADPSAPTPARPASSVDWRGPDRHVDTGLLEGLLAGVALLLTVFVVATSLALAAAETRDERDTLAAVGASPATMRRTSARRAVILTAMGAVLAVAVGWVPMAVFAAASPSNPPLLFPWRTVLALVLAIPLLAGLVTGAGSALALRFRPVRVSTIAVE